MPHRISRSWYAASIIVGIWASVGLCFGVLDMTVQEVARHGGVVIAVVAVLTLAFILWRVIRLVRAGEGAVEGPDGRIRGGTKRGLQPSVAAQACGSDISDDPPGGPDPE